MTRCGWCARPFADDVWRCVFTPMALLQMHSRGHEEREQKEAVAAAELALARPIHDIRPLLSNSFGDRVARNPHECFCD